MIDCLRSLLRPVSFLSAAAAVAAMALSAGAQAQTAPASAARTRSRDSLTSVSAKPTRVMVEL